MRKRKSVSPSCITKFGGHWAKVFELAGEERSGLLTLIAEAKSDMPATWQSAVSQLALRSPADGQAMQAWSDLLLSYQPELRLRGLHGLRTLAGSQPDAVARFMLERFEEQDTYEDPVFLRLLVHMMNCLPTQHQDRLFEALAGYGESGRCAAVEVLWGQAQVRGPQLLLEWAQDSSPRVRSHLALVLCEKMPSSQAFEPLLRLVRDAELEVRTAVAMGMADIEATGTPGFRRGLEYNPEFRQLQRLLQQQPSLQLIRESASEMAPNSEHPLNQLLHVVNGLEARPRQALHELTPWVRLAGSWHRLKTVADFARDPQVAWAARGLSQLCRYGDPSERVLGCLGALNEASGNPVLREFADMCRCTLELLDSSSWLDLRNWSERWRKQNSGRLELRWSEFVQLADKVSQWNSPEEARAGLEALSDTSGMGPLPERELLEPALMHVHNILVGTEGSQ